MPAQVEQWHRWDYKTIARQIGNAEGEHSKIWTYQKLDLVGSLSLDYLFTSWHQLTWCYTGQGWRVDEEVFHKPEIATDNVGYMEVNMSRSVYSCRFLLYCNLDERGTALEPPSSVDLRSYIESRLLTIRHRLGFVPKTNAPATQPLDMPVYELQLFVESYRPLTQTEREQAKVLFLRGVRSLREQLGK